MAVFLLFLSYLFGLLALSPLVVPAIYPGMLEPLGLKPESALYRLPMLMAAIALPLFLRLMALNSWQAAGFTLPRRAAWLALAKGLLLGISIMVVLTALLWALGAHEFAPPTDKWSALYLLRYAIAGLLTGLAVGFIEEVFFRGLMHTGMRRRSLGFWPTAVLTATLYAALHFMKPESPGPGVFDTNNAYQMIWTGVSRVTDLGPVHDSFVTLVLVGIFLSMVRELTGSILWSIGIHAGWVMVIKVFKYLTDTATINGQTSIWVGDYDDITGWLASIWIGLIMAIYWLRSDREKRGSGFRQASGSGSTPRSISPARRSSRLRILPDAFSDKLSRITKRRGI